MKNSGIEWIGEIPDSWKLVRFKDICVNKKEIAGESSENYERLALTLGGVIKRPKYDSDGLQPKEFDGYQIICENDFIFKMIDLQNISTSRVGLSPYCGLVSPAYIRFSSREEGQYNEYVYYFLMSMYYNCVYNNLGGNGVRSALNATAIGQLVIPFPAIEKQKKIVAFLENAFKKIDNLIEVQQAQIDKLKEYKQSVITEAVTKGLDPTVPMKDSGVEWIGMIPCEWMVEKLKFHATVNNEKKFGEQLPYIALENIEGFTGKLIDTENVYDVNEAIVAEKGDVLFGKLRPYLAKVYRVQNKSYVSSEFAVFRCNDVSSNFLKWYMLGYGFLDTVNASTCGTKMPRANIDFISNMPIPVISIEEQEKIAAHIDTQCAKIDKLIAIKQAKIDKLQEYKKSLIYEYVTGKKEVV